MSPALVVVLLLAAPVSGEPAGCPTVAEVGEAALRDGEVAVALHEVPGAEAKEGCAVGWVPAPLSEVLAVVWDAATYDEFLPHVRSSEVASGDDGELRNTQHLSLPFPIRDRYYTVRLERVDDADGGAEVRWSYVPGSGNVVDTRGSWRLVPEGESGTWVTYRVLTDPGGMLPKWAVNRASRRTLPDVLEALRRRVLSLRHDS